MKERKYSLFWLIFWIIVCFPVAYYYYFTRQNPNKKIMNEKPAKYIFIGLIVFYCLIIFSSILSDIGQQAIKEDYNKVDTLIENKQYNEALIFIDSLLDEYGYDANYLKGKKASVYFYLGLEETNTEKQIEYYEKCIELNPKATGCLNNLGLVFVEIGEIEKGEELLKMVEEVESKETTKTDLNTGTIDFNYINNLLRRVIDVSFNEDIGQLIVIREEITESTYIGMTTGSNKDRMIGTSTFLQNRLLDSAFKDFEKLFQAQKIKNTDMNNIHLIYKTEFEYSDIYGNKEKRTEIIAEFIMLKSEAEKIVNWREIHNRQDQYKLPLLAHFSFKK